MFRAFLNRLGLARVYLASPSVGWHLALQFALQHPERLEGCVLVEAHEVETDARRGVLSLAARLHEIAVPTLVLLTEQGHAACAALQLERLPRYTPLVISDATASAGVPALRLAHAMMPFLLHCERQRNLVRGASFLL
jgi:pimeloyl-ACP methyl ester carboxylesterase